MTRIDSAHELIDRSIEQYQLSHATYTDALHLDLLAECDDSADHGDYMAYWGVDERGYSWRVRLTKAARS